MRMPLGDLRKFAAFFSTEFFCPQISTDYHRFFLISKDIVIITDYYHQLIIINQPNQSLWLLICVNLCQSVVYERTDEVEKMLLVVRATAGAATAGT